MSLLDVALLLAGFAALFGLVAFAVSRRTRKDRAPIVRWQDGGTGR